MRNSKSPKSAVVFINTFHLQFFVKQSRKNMRQRHFFVIGTSLTPPPWTKLFLHPSLRPFCMTSPPHPSIDVFSLQCTPIYFEFFFKKAIFAWEAIQSKRTSSQSSNNLCSSCHKENKIKIYMKRQKNVKVRPDPLEQILWHFHIRCIKQGSVSPSFKHTLKNVFFS